MSKNTFVGLGDRFAGFIEDEIARGRRDALVVTLKRQACDACPSPATTPPLPRLNEARDLFT